MLPWWHTHFVVSFYETDKIGALKMFPIYNKFFNQMTVFVDFIINPARWWYVRAEKLQRNEKKSSEPIYVSETTTRLYEEQQSPVFWTGGCL